MATINIPFTFSPNTPAYSAQVNANISAITAQVNGNLDDANIRSGGVTPSRLATQPRAKAVLTIPFNQLNGQGGTMLLGAAEFDTDNLYDDVNDYFTVQTAGMYQCSAYALQAAPGASTLLIRRGPGGVFPAPGVGAMVASDDNRNGTNQHVSACGIDYFAVGDRIDFQWYNYAGGQNGLSLGIVAAQWLSP